MPALVTSLQGRDLGHLRIVAELWGVELQAQEAGRAIEELAVALTRPMVLAEIVAALPPEARAALEALAESGGRIPWVAFVRRFGELREMGPGRRDRERPYLRPVSASEILYYRALLARAFFDTPNGPQEFAYLPDEFLKLLGPREAAPDEPPPGRPATEKERASVQTADDRILDHAATLLAAARLGVDYPPPGLVLTPWPFPVPVLRALLESMNLFEPDGAPRAEAVRAFLEAPRGRALLDMVQAWRASETFNELRLLPGLSCEGEWTNDPRAARRFILARLAAIPPDKWWSLPAFLADFKNKHPDFQRPAGDYDSWFIRRLSDGVFLRGFGAWDEVDGALVKYILTGPMHWLGLLDLAAPQPGAPPAAFRWSAGAQALLGGRVPAGGAEENERLQARSHGRLHVPRLAPRTVRYQLARFCEWEKETPHDYAYRVTPASLERARAQGLKIEQLIALLQKHAGAPLPPAFLRALQRWEQKGTEARLEQQVILRVASPEVLEALRHSRAARFLGDPLGPTAVIVRAGAQAQVLSALAEMGYLAEDTTKTDIIDSEK